MLPWQTFGGLPTVGLADVGLEVLVILKRKTSLSVISKRMSFDQTVAQGE